MPQDSCRVSRGPRSTACGASPRRTLRSLRSGNGRPSGIGWGSARACRSSRCRRSGSFSSAIPSRRRFTLPDSSVVNRRSAIASVSMRLISSGIVRSKLRSPASTCATANTEFRRDQRARDGRVHVADHEDDVRPPLEQDLLEGHHDRGGLHGVGCRAHPEVHVRARNTQLLEEDLRHLLRRSAGRYARAGARCAPAAAFMASDDGAIFMKFGRAPTTLRIFIARSRETPAGLRQCASAAAWVLSSEPGQELLDVVRRNLVPPVFAMASLMASATSDANPPRRQRMTPGCIV